MLKNLIPWTRNKAMVHSPANNNAAGTMTALHRALDDFFALPWCQPFGTEMNAGLVPTADVAESERAIEVSLELPGMREKDVEVDVTEDVLTIRGENRKENEDTTEGWTVFERQYGSFYRAFSIPKTVDTSKVEARFKDGVLTVTLPKREDAATQTRRISVRAA
jgi:HSP20 family protein